MTDEDEANICPCGGDTCDGGYGYKWRSGDLGNTHRVGNTSYKAGRMWAEVCSHWVDEHGKVLPPNPPGIGNITRYLKKATLKEFKTDEDTQKTSRASFF